MPAQPPLPEPAAQRPVVLLVDDEEDILASLKSVLEEYLPEAQVRTAQSARAAQRLLRETGARVVVADFRMPGISGLQLLSEIRDSNSEVVRIMMTAYPAVGLIVRAVNEAKIRSIFVKPFDGMKMVSEIREALRDVAAA